MPALFDLKNNLSLKIIGATGQAFYFHKGSPQLITAEADINKFSDMSSTFVRVDNGNGKNLRSKSGDTKPKSFSKMSPEGEERPSLSPTPDVAAKVIHPDSEEAKETSPENVKPNIEEEQKEDEQLGMKKSEHPEELVKEQKPFVCEICQETFKTSQALSSHMRYTHNKKRKKTNKGKKKK